MNSGPAAIAAITSAPSGPYLSVSAAASRPIGEAACSAKCAAELCGVSTPLAQVIGVNALAEISWPVLRSRT
jgi:hypothetical protein